MGIRLIRAREILDSRGRPTIEATAFTQKFSATASVPSGASRGRHEAVELRDGGKRYSGLGVLKAVSIINTRISKALAGKDPAEQEEIDRTLKKLDGTKNKSRLGANTMLPVSLACARLAAAEQEILLYRHIARLYGNRKITMPVPAFNLINGGMHAGNRLDFQEYLLLPSKAKSFPEAMQIGAEVYNELRQLLQNDFGRMATNVGDEGGFAPPMSCIEEPLDYISDAAQNLGCWNRITLGIDAAASTLCKNKRYSVEGAMLTAEKLMQAYLDMLSAYPMKYLEDPFSQDDFGSFAKLAGKKRCIVVSDDLTCTNPARIRKAIKEKSCNAVIIKPNQIGTLTETLDAARTAAGSGLGIVVSHRSSETNDDFIADLAAGIGAGWIKAGAPCRAERLAKYNRLLEIAQDSGAGYAR